ncbi:MAG TPA: YHS domain-containing protein, partial [Longimicrobium sp.]|nr:YHS domain-containing protein [Longimicrobium sp.]
MADRNQTIIDPVCGMTVDPESAADSSEHGGQTYWFCSAGCKQRFDADPAKYAGSASDESSHTRHQHAAQGHGGASTITAQPMVQLGMGRPKAAHANGTGGATPTQPVVQLQMGRPRTAPDADAGPAERVDIPITGMTCAACASRVQRSLSKAPGVRRAGVNLMTNRATVEYDPATTGLRDLMGVVKDTGYGTAGTTRAEFVVDDSARPGGSSQPLEHHLLR